MPRAKTLEKELLRKRKISEVMKGKPKSEEHKRNLSKANKGNILSEETKKKISKNNAKFWLGKKLSEEHKRKLSEAHKGKPSGNKGKKFTNEQKKKLKQSLTGRKLSKEHKIKISEAHKGKKCNFWKGGITSESQKIRVSIEFRLWREAVFARDNWTCQKCKIKGYKLHPHHIQNFAQYPEQRFAIDNGITFCKNCHRLFHKIYGIKNNTKEQLEKFLEKINYDNERIKEE